MAWFVYILKCRDGSFYVGMTDDPVRRIVAHNQGKGARYTRGRRPVSLVYWEKLSGRSEAQKREIEIKSFSKSKKQELVTGFLAAWPCCSLLTPDP